MSTEVEHIETQSLRRPISFKRRLLFSAVIYLSFVLFLCAIEAATRLALPHVNSLDLFVSTPQQKAQVADEKQSGIFEGDPLLLWRLRPNLANVVWDFTVLSTNAEHFRAFRPVLRKEPGVFRILCIGDSVTFGYRVPVVWPDKPNEYDRTWLPYPMLLEKELSAANPDRKIEAIVMAVPGYTSHQGLAWLRRDIEWLEPDLVTVSFGWNDASMSDVPDRDAIRTEWYVVGTRWLVDHSQAFAHATRWLRSRNKKSASQAVKPVPRVSEGEYLANIAEMIRLANKHGARGLVIAAPYRDAVTNPPEAKLMTQYRAALRQWAEQTQVPYLEVRELTEAAHPSNQGWFGELIHPNHMGHRLIASELLTQFKTQGLLKEMTVPILTP
jgi:lysophospholipase L1-like esterase